MLLSLVIFSSSALAENKNSAREIIIGFAKNTKDSDIKILEKKYQLTLIKKFKRIYAIQYKIDTSKLSEIINLLQAEKIVRYAEANNKTKAKAKTKDKKSLKAQLQ